MARYSDAINRGLYEAIRNINQTRGRDAIHRVCTYPPTGEINDRRNTLTSHPYPISLLDNISPALIWVKPT